MRMRISFGATNHFKEYKSETRNFPCCYSLVMGDKGTKNYDNFVLGNINKISIYDAWNSEKMKKLRRLQVEGKFNQNPTCKMCVKFTFPTKKTISEYKRI